ncbi:MAG: Dabb family protein [Phycisphaerales bacterium]|nr:Dabb family protein [Phycisphaerales bacterium]
MLVVRLLLVLGAMMTVCAGGCATTPARPPRPAVISHIVFFKLNDPADADALIAACDARIAPIPGITAYACGRHVDTGRATVASDYDVGCVIGFDSTASYARYVEHPEHVAVVSAWRPRLTWLKVYDVLDPTP